jgi:Fibronectin type III domain
LIAGYTISYARSGGTWTSISVAPSARSRVFSGLTNGATYYFRVSAYSVDGRSPSTTSVSAVPRTVPSVPRSLTATPGYHQMTLRWAAPASTGGSPITGYTISYATGGGTWTRINVSASTRARTITGLRGGATYYFYVTAYNVAGRSVAASVKAVPKAYTKPGAPSIYSVTNGNRSVGLRWSQPTDTGGLPITSYLVQIGSGGVWRNLGWVSGGTRAYTATGLVNGRTYYFRVAAGNRLGPGPWSPSVRAVPVAPPLPSPPPPPVTFGGGTYRVGVDIPAGTYRSPRSTSDWCYWERLSGFSGDFDDIIANDFIDGTGPFVVTILPSDRGFFAESVCGTWTKIGSNCVSRTSSSEAQRPASAGNGAVRLLFTADRVGDEGMDPAADGLAR